MITSFKNSCPSNGGYCISHISMHFLLAILQLLLLSFSWSKSGGKNFLTWCRFAEIMKKTESFKKHFLFMIRQQKKSFFYLKKSTGNFSSNNQCFLSLRVSLCAPKLLRSSAQLNCSVDMERNSRSSSSSRRSNAE